MLSVMVMVMVMVMELMGTVWSQGFSISSNPRTAVSSEVRSHTV